MRRRARALWLGCLMAVLALHEARGEGRYEAAFQRGKGLAAPLEAAAQAQLASVRRQTAPDELVRIEAGQFQMGSSANEPGRGDDELQHAVQISRPYLLGRTEVTQAQYQAVMGQNSSADKTSPQNPVEQVSWLQAVSYCNKRSEQEGLPGCYQIDGERVTWPQGLKCRGYRLPTEAEWEYAARAGQATRFAGSDDASKVAWFSTDRVRPVAGKHPNRWGLYDMSGSVWEWVWDWKDAYSNQRVLDPVGPATGRSRVVRGGSWVDGVVGARVAFRSYDHPGARDPALGFRVARSLP